jgi:hypothetical protein
MTSKLFTVSLILGTALLLGCSSDNNTPAMNDPDNVTLAKFTENFHSSLPDTWVTEYNTIKGKLLTILPLYQKYYRDIVVYAWNNKVDEPYEGVEEGKYVSTENNDETIQRMVLAITKQEFDEKHTQRHAVIVHEYFHLYQKSLNFHMNKYDAHPTSFRTKWLIEGAAATVEGIYIKQHYGISYTAEQQNDVHNDVLESPAKFETHAASGDIDTNYSSSIFLVLVLAKELQLSGLTETKSFQLILRDYMMANPNKETWKALFAETFNMTLDQFYAELPGYVGLKNADVLPTSTLTLEDIFSTATP